MSSNWILALLLILTMVCASPTYVGIALTCMTCIETRAQAPRKKTYFAKLVSTTTMACIYGTYLLVVHLDELLSIITNACTMYAVDAAACVICVGVTHHLYTHAMPYLRGTFIHTKPDTIPTQADMEDDHEPRANAADVVVSVFHAILATMLIFGTDQLGIPLGSLFLVFAASSIATINAVPFYIFAVITGLDTVATSIISCALLVVVWMLYGAYDTRRNFTKRRKVISAVKNNTTPLENREVTVQKLFQILGDKSRGLLDAIAVPELASMLSIIAGIPIPDTTLFITILQRLHVFLHTPIKFKVAKIVNGKMVVTVEESAPWDQYHQIANHDAHRNVPDKGCDCGKECTESCVHHAESLIMHLFAAAVIASVMRYDSYGSVAYVVALLKDRCCGTRTVTDACFEAFMTGFLHDCAKYHTVKIASSSCSVDPDGKTVRKNMSYPGHAVASAISTQLMHKALLATGLTELSCARIVRAVQLHMHIRPMIACGNLKSLLMEAPATRALLGVLYCGDCLGKKAEQEHEVSEEDILDELQKLASWVVDNTTDKISTIWSLFPSKRKMVILLQGTSGSGKSSVIPWIEATLGLIQTVVISSDVAMNMVLTGTDTRPFGKLYAMLYTVRQTAKEYHNKPSEETKKAYRQAVQKAKKGGVKLLPFVDGPNIPNVKGMCHDEMKRMVQKASDDDSIHYIVMDTVMSLYPDSLALIMPIDMRTNAIFVSVPISNYATSKKATKDSNGLTDDEQNALSGPQGFGTPSGGAFANSGLRPLGESKMPTDENDMPMADSVHPWRPDWQMHPLTLVPNEEGEPMYNGMVAFLSSLARITGNGPTGVVECFNDYSGTEYLQHLMVVFKGNVLGVRAKLVSQSVNMNGVVVGGQWDTLKEHQRKYAIKNCVKQSQALFEHGIITRALTYEEFASSDALCMTYLFMYVTLKYREGVNGPTFWSMRYMMDFRGQKFFIHPETGKVTCLSYLMPRGKEVLNVLTKEQNAEYAGVKSGVFDIIQALFMNPDARVNAIITSKADGSMVSVIVAQGYVLKLWKCCIEVYGTPEAQHIAKRSLELTDGEQVVIITTQGSLSLNEHMTSYILTSVLAGIHKDGTQYASRDDLRKVSPVEALVEYGDPFLTDVINFSAQCYAKVPETESVTLIFEGICKNRQGMNEGLWRDDQHNELATNYDVDVLTWIGFSVTGVKGKWREGFITHSAVQFQHNFCEPFAWKVVSTMQINAMSKDMNEVIFNRMSKDEFLAKYSDFTGGEADILDFEGFVCMVCAIDVQEINETHPDHLFYTAFSSVFMIYAKLKAEAYYKAHGYREGNITYLINLERCAPGVFPLATKISAIIASCKIIDLIGLFIQKVDCMFDMTKPNNVVKDLLEQTFGVYTEGDKAHPQYVLAAAKGHGRERMDAFIKRVLTPQNKTENSLCDKVRDMYIALFINDFNVTFGTRIQTFTEIEAIHRFNMVQGFKLTKTNALKTEFTIAMNLIELLMSQLKDLDALRQRCTSYDSTKIIALLLKTGKLTRDEKDDATFFKTMVSLMLSSPLLQSHST